MDRQRGGPGEIEMTIRQLRHILKTAGHILARAAPIILAIADALSGRSSKRKPRQ